MTTTPLSGMLVIPGRFNGPPGSGNGGYSCGLVSSLIDGDAEVTLRSPPPLDVELDVARTTDGVEVLNGTTLVATARVAEEPMPEVPYGPTWDEAVAASSGYLGFEGHEFPTCFTCGPRRGDGLGIFPGSAAGDVVAAPWAPDGSLPNEDGVVSTPIVWAALDCPGAWADARDIAEQPIVLGRMAAAIYEPVTIGARYVAVGWQLGAEGRKSYAGTALIDDSGVAVAVARQIWIAI